MIRTSRGSRKSSSSSTALRCSPDKDGGYSFEFVDSTYNDDLLCKICLLPSRDAQLSECCGHTFCKTCVYKVKRSSDSDKNKSCPVCCNKEFQTFSNKQIDRKVRSLLVYCSNRDKGCKWQGEVNDIQNHLQNNGGCEFEEMMCPNECGVIVQRQNLTYHVKSDCPCRKAECEYCHETGDHQFIQKKHKEQCPKVPVECPNHCDVENILREDLDEHRKVCSLEMVSCKYMKLGCGAKMVRKEEEEHRKEKMEEHLFMAIGRIDQLETASNSKHIYLLDQLRVLETRILHLTDNLWSQHIAALAASAASNNHVLPVIVKMDEYSKVKANRKLWCSPSFYTHVHGYTMCLGVGPVGYTSKSHLSVYLYIRKGEHDHLVWPLHGVFEVTLLNQSCDSGHHSNKIPLDRYNEDNTRRPPADIAYKGWGFVEFVSDKCLTANYLKDDSIYFRITFST